MNFIQFHFLKPYFYYYHIHLFYYFYINYINLNLYHHLIFLCNRIELTEQHYLIIIIFETTLYCFVNFNTHLIGFNKHLWEFLYFKHSKI